MNMRALTLMLKDSFEYAERNNGESYVRCKDGAPEWIHDVIRECHDGMLPDDYKYAFIADAVEALVESSGDYDKAVEIVDSQVDVYSSDLTAWLNSNTARSEYMDQAIDSFGHIDNNGPNTFSLLTAAQAEERREVLNLLFDELHERSH